VLFKDLVIYGFLIESLFVKRKKRVENLITGPQFFLQKKDLNQITPASLEKLKTNKKYGTSRTDNAENGGKYNGSHHS
jgi:hypothetical protein